MLASGSYDGSTVEMSINDDSAPLLAGRSRSPTPSYGSPSESESESNGGLIVRHLIQTSASPMEELSNSLTVEETRSLKEKSTELRGHHAIRLASRAASVTWCVPAA